MKTKKTKKLNERKTLRHWKTKIFGFPVVIDEVEAFRFEDEWVPDVDYTALGDELVDQLLDSHRSLTGSQMRFVRKHLHLKQEDLASLIGKEQPHIARSEARKNDPAFESYADQFTLILQLKSKWISMKKGKTKPSWEDIFSAEEFENEVEPEVQLKTA